MSKITYCKIIFKSQYDFEKATFYKELDSDSSFEHVGPGKWNKDKNTLSFLCTAHNIPFKVFSTMAKDLNIDMVCEFSYRSHHTYPDLIIEIKKNGKMSNIKEIPEKKVYTKPLVLSDQDLLSSPLMIQPLEFDNETISPEQNSIKIQKDITGVAVISDIILNIILAAIFIGSILTIIELMTDPTQIKTINDIIGSITSTFPSIIIILIPSSLILGTIFWVNDLAVHICQSISMRKASFSSKYQKKLDFEIFSRNINELRDIVIEQNIGSLESPTPLPLELPLVSSWSDFFTDKPEYNANIKYRLFYLIDNYAMDSFLEISNDKNPELMDELLKPFMISILIDVKNKYNKHIIFEKQYQEKKENDLKEKIKRDIEIFEKNN